MSRRTFVNLILTVLVALLGIGVGSAHASSAPDAGRAFTPPPPPPQLFGVKPPTADPGRQVRIVKAADGTDLYTDTWLPAAKDGKTPPARVPVVVVYTPYSSWNSPAQTPPIGATDYNDYIIPWLVRRGYAVTYAHVRGTGRSGGCWERGDVNQATDGASIVKDAGESAPWASGSVGMFGLSQPGDSQLLTATGPDRMPLRSLRALVVGAPPAFYEFFYHDGVPEIFEAPAAVMFGLFRFSLAESPERYLIERVGCQFDAAADAIQQSGDYTPYIAAHDYLANLSRMKTPLLMWHGTADINVNGYVQAGFFDELPDGVPHKGVFGVHDHNPPDDHSFNEAPYSQPQLDWEREDWEAMVLAWYERWLRGVPNGANRWPTAQVQGTDGQWHGVSRWPRIHGPRGKLALGADGTLGTRTPTGTTPYTETPPTYPAGTPDPPGSSAVFETPPLAGRLELVGLPKLDLWISLQQPDSHVAVKLEALRADGKRTIYQAWTHGARSARHLDPLVDGRFRQTAGRPAPTGTPFKLALRFNPLDLVVPKGGSLRLTVAGSVESWSGADEIQQGTAEFLPGKTTTSGVVQEVTILHSCEYPSELRFSLPEHSSQLLDIREKDQSGPLGQRPNAPAPPVDGGGLATRETCRAGTPHNAGCSARFQRGTEGDDRMIGTERPDRLTGRGGDDRLGGLGGGDCIRGGPGDDRVTGNRGRDRIVGGDGSDGLRGGRGRDRIVGRSGGDLIRGGTGQNLLLGGRGDDTIRAKVGGDRVRAGLGNDVVRSNDARRDRIDCGPGRDRVTADRKDAVTRNCERVALAAPGRRN